MRDFLCSTQKVLCNTPDQVSSIDVAPYSFIPHFHIKKANNQAPEKLYFIKIDNNYKDWATLMYGVES